MTRVVAAVALAFGIAVAAGSSETSASPTQTGPNLAAPPAVIVQYGHVRTLVRAGARYRLGFDPALWLSGETANRAAVEDGVIPKGETVPNDYYVRDESKKLLTYVAPPTARVSVITLGGTGGLHWTRIAVSELAAIVKGRNPKGRKLYGSQLGYWIRVRGDTVTSLDQQYQP
jgi:hypothetical protein